MQKSTFWPCGRRNYIHKLFFSLTCNGLPSSKTNDKVKTSTKIAHKQRQDLHRIAREPLSQACQVVQRRTFYWRNTKRLQGFPSQSGSKKWDDKRTPLRKVNKCLVSSKKLIFSSALSALFFFQLNLDTTRPLRIEIRCQLLKSKHAYIQMRRCKSLLVFLTFW